MCLYIHILYAYMYIYTHVSNCIYKHISKCVCVCIDTYEYMYIYICLYMYIHIHLHICGAGIERFGPHDVNQLFGRVLGLRGGRLAADYQASLGVPALVDYHEIGAIFHTLLSSKCGIWTINPVVGHFVLRARAVSPAIQSGRRGGRG